MSSNYDPLMLELVHRLRAKVDALAGERRDLQHRMIRAEQQPAAFAAVEAVHHAVTTVRLDGVEARLDGIERLPEPRDCSDTA